jgi:hypothetical protein
VTKKISSNLSNPVLEAQTSLQKKKEQQAKEQEAMTKQVKITDEVHKLLGNLGEFGETYGDIIERVTKHYASCPEARKEREKRRQRSGTNTTSS